MSTLTTLISRVRRRIEDPQSLHWSDAEVIGSVNEAKQDLFDHIYLRNRDCLVTSQHDYTWPANSMSESLESVVLKSIGTYEVLLISTTPTSESVGVNNRPVPLHRVNFEELYRRSYESPIFYDALVDEAGNAEVWGGGSPSREATMRWAQQGYRLYLDPIPRRDTQIRLEVIERFREFKEDGTESSLEVFPSLERPFARWERLLEYMVVAVLKGRSDEVQDPALIQMQQKMQLLNAWLDTRSITGTPRVVNRGY